MRNYNITEEYKKQLKEKEGFRSEEYWDRNGMAWGYGSHSSRPNNNPTIEDADKQFEKDIRPMIKRANQLLDVDLTQGQFNVVVDMMYNVGEGNMKQAFARINSGQIREMGEKLSEYNKSKDTKTGKMEVLPALQKRAAWRKEMWDSSEEVQVNRNDELDAKAVPPESLDLFSIPKKEYDLPTDIKGNKEYEGRARKEQVTSGVSDEAFLSAVQEDEPQEDDNLSGVSDDDYLNAVQNDSSVKEEFAEPVERRTPEPIFDGVSRLETAEVLSKDIDINHGKQTRQISKSKKISEDRASAYVSSPDFSSLEKQDSRRDLSNLYPDLVNWGSRPENFKLLEQDTSGLQLISEEALSWRVGIDAGKRAFINAGVYSSIFAENNGMVDVGTLAIDEMRDSVKGLSSTYQMRGTRKIDRAMTRTSRSFGKAVDIASDLLGVDNEEEIADASVLHLLKQTGTTFGEIFNTLGTFATNKKALGVMMAQSMESSLLPITGGVGGGIVGGFLYGSQTAGTLTQLGVLHGRVAGGLSASYINAYGIYYSELVDKSVQSGIVKSYSEFQQNKNRRDDAHSKATRYAALQSPIQVAGQMLAGRFMSKYVRPDIILGKQTAKQIAKGVVGKVAGKGTVLAQEAGQGAAFNFMEELFPRLLAGENIKTATGEATTEAVLGGPSSSIQSVVGFTFNELSSNGGFVYRRRVKKLYHKMAKVMDASKDMASYERLKEAYTKSATAKQYDEQVGDLVNESSAKKVEVASAPAEVEGNGSIETQPTSEDMKVQENEIANGDGEQYIRFDPDEMIAILEEEGLDVEDVIQELGPEFAEGFKQAFIEGGEVKVKVTDFLSKVEDDSRFKGIMRFGENELSANDVIASEGSFHSEVEEIIRKSEDSVEGETQLGEDQKITKAQAKARAEKWQDVPLDERPKVITPNGNVIDGDVVLRQMKIMQKYKLDKEGKQVLASVLKQASNAVLNVDYMTPAEKEGFVPLLAEQHFNHIAMRARVTGQSIAEVAKKMIIRGETVKERRKNLKNIYQGEGGHSGALYSGARAGGLQNMVLVLASLADISTMTHELGHAWLYDMMYDWDDMHSMNEESMTKEQKDYKDAMVETAKLLGIDSLSSFLKDAERSQQLLNQGKSKGAEYKKLRRERLEGQETFAQTSEKYFLDGEYENVGIRKVFMVMQSFMQNLLKRGRDIGGAYAEDGVFPLKIDPVVESIFETILGAREMAQDAMEAMHPQITINPEDFGKDGPAFMEAYNEAAEDTEAAIVSRLIIRKGRQQEKEQTKIIDEAFDEAEGIINASMPNQVRLALQKIGKGDPTLRISEKSFSEAYSKKYGSDWRKKIPKGIVNGKNKKGVDLSEVIAAFAPMVVEGEGEVMSERDFFEVLIEAGAKDERIEELASDIINRQSIPNLTEQEIFDIAVEEAGGIRRDIFLRRTFNFMMSKFRKEFKNLAGVVMTPEEAQNKVLKENVRPKAEASVNEAPYKGFNAKAYHRLSVQKGRAAAKAWKKGDLAEALNLKIEQIQQGEAYRYAEKQSKLLSKAILNMKKIANVSLVKVADAFETDIYISAQSLLHNFNNGQLLQHIEMAGDKAMALKFPNIVGEAWLEAMNTHIDKLNDKLEEEGRGTPSVSTVLTLNKIVEGIRKAAREAKKLEVSGKKITLSLEQSKFANQVGPRQKGDRKKAPESGYKGAPALWNKFWVGTRKVETQLAGIFENDAAWISSVPGRLFSKVKDAESERSVSQQDAKVKIKKKVEAAAKANKKNKVRGKNIISKIINHTFQTKEEIYVFMANMGSESSLEALAMGGTRDIDPKSLSMGMNPETKRIDDRKMWAAIQEMIDNGDISIEDVQLVQEVLDAFKPYHAKVDQATKNVKGYRVGKIEARPFTLVFDGKEVTFDGGYFPLRRSELDRKLEVGDQMKDTGVNSTSTMYPFMNMGLVKQRRKNPFKISLSWDTAVNMGLKNTTSIAFMLEPMNNFAKFMNGGEVHAALENRFPDFYKDTLIPWYQRTTEQMYTPTHAFDSSGLKINQQAAQFIRANMRAHWYFGKLATGAVQTIGFVQAMHAVGAKRVVKHIQISASNFTTNKEHIIKVSPRMRDRFDMNEAHRVADMDDIVLSSSLWTKATELQRRMNFIIIQTAQNYVDVGVYMAAEEKAIEDGLTGADVDAYASRMVDRTQGSAVISDRSNLQQATPIEKLGQGFTDIPMMLLHQFKLEWLRTQNTPMPEKVQRRAYILFTTAIVPALVLESMRMAGEEVVSTLFEDEEDEDEEAKLEKYNQSASSRLALRVLNEGLDIGIPIGGKYLAEAVNYVSGRHASFRPSAELATIGQVGRKAGLGKLFTEVDLTLKEITAQLQLATIATGFPLLPLAARSVELYDKLLESEEDKQERSERILDQRALDREQKLEKLDERGLL